MMAAAAPYLARAGARGDDDMKAFRSTPAQIVAASAATVALLYFFRDVLAPFLLGRCL